MTPRRSPRAVLPWLFCALMAGCANQPQPYDYSAFRAHPPRSILVLPPINQGTTVEGTYGFLSAATRPLAEHGYYVFPVSVVDHFMKAQGMPGAGEMHEVPLARAREILGADAVLFVTLERYGQTYVVVDSVSEVRIRARLYDTASETLIWEGSGFAQSGLGGGGDPLARLVAAVVVQAIGSSTDASHGLSPVAMNNMLASPKRGLPYGPYHPKAGLTE